MKRILAFVGLFASALTLSAADPSIGTWKKVTNPPAPGVPSRELFLVVEAGTGTSRHLTWKAKNSGGPETILMTLDTALDGSESPVLGATGLPTGQTMAITRLDDHHSTTVTQVRGHPFSTSKAEISADGRTMTIVTTKSEATPGGGVEVTEIWEKQ